MQPKKYDSFQPKRATSIDGFFTKPVSNRPRQPVFPASTPVKPQRQSDTLADMPRRAQPQPILASGRQPASTAVPIAAVPLDGVPGDRPRQRGRRRELAQEQPVKEKVRKQKKKSIGKRIAKWGGIVVLVLVIALGGFLYKNFSKLTGNKNPFSLLSAFTPAHLKNQDGRVNILVAGNSADDVGHDGANLTDSIMVLSVNTRNNTALMLSVPRDLWVNIPGVGHSKINAAYPNGGMDTLQQVIEDNLGLAIDYHVLVNYSAFKDLVNAVSGITITIKSNDPRGIYDPSIDYTSSTCCALAKYPNGSVTLNGQQALDLARARGDSYGSYGFDMADFDRTQHQRDMLIAIKNKTSQSSVIANPFKIVSLISAVGNNVKSNLQVNEIETLYSYMKKVDDSKIASYNINTLKGTGTTMLANYTSDSGQSALIPAAGLDDFTDIQAQIIKLLSADPLAREGASVVVLNGTETPGLAAKQETSLAAKGMNLSAGDAPADQATTTIIDNSAGKMPNTLTYLEKLYSATVVTNATLTAGYPSANFIVILGANVVSSSTTTSTTAGQ